MRRALSSTFALAFCLALSGDGFGDREAPGSGPSGDSRAGLQHAETVTSYTLQARLDPQTHRLVGSGSVTLHNTSTKELGEVWVHLYLNAFKNDRSAFLREQNGGGRGNRLPASWGTIDVKRFAHNGVDLWPKAELHREGDADETDVRVPLASPLAPGAEARFDMTWDATLPSVVERTGFAGSFHMVGQWFPKLAKLEPNGEFAHFPFHHLAEFYANFGEYDVTIDVPKEFVLGATGIRTESRVVEGRSIQRYVQKDIHDFAFAAWDKFREREESIGGVRVRVLFPPGYDAVAARELDTIRFALPHFGEHYGPYPYSVLTVVHPPEGDASEAGGMEYPTLITTGGPWYTPPFVRSIEAVTIHEFGHQYFYGLLASNEMKWPFLDEGLNSYAETESLAMWLGEGSGGSLGSLDVSVAGVHAGISKLSQHDEIVAKPAHEFHNGGSYARLVYSRTATILETLARVYGRPRLTTALRDYANQFRFRHPVPDDLLQVLGQHFGPAVRTTVRQALFEKGWIDYAVLGFGKPSSRAPSGLFDEGGKRETKKGENANGDHFVARIAKRGPLVFPVEVAFYFDDGTSKRVTWAGDAEEGVVSLSVAARKCVGVVVDPDHRVLLDTDLRNNAMGSRSGQPSALLGATAIGDLLLGALVP